MTGSLYLYIATMIEANVEMMIVNEYIIIDYALVTWLCCYVTWDISQTMLEVSIELLVGKCHHVVSRLDVDTHTHIHLGKRIVASRL